MAPREDDTTTQSAFGWRTGPVLKKGHFGGDSNVLLNKGQKCEGIFTPKNTRIKYYKYKTPPLVVVTTLGVRSIGKDTI